MHGASASGVHASSKAYVDSAIAAIPSVDLSDLLPKAGGTMIGALTLSGAHTRNLYAITKKNVKNQLTVYLLNGYLLSGGKVIAAKTFFDNIIFRRKSINMHLESTKTWLTLWIR